MAAAYENGMNMSTVYANWLPDGSLFSIKGIRVAQPLVAISVCTSADCQISYRNVPMIRKNMFPTIKSEIQIR